MNQDSALGISIGYSCSEARYKNPVVALTLLIRVLSLCIGYCSLLVQQNGNTSTLT